MKDYKFKIGDKTITLSATDVDSAYNFALSFARSNGWIGRIQLIN